MDASAAASRFHFNTDLIAGIAKLHNELNNFDFDFDNYSISSCSSFDSFTTVSSLGTSAGTDSLTQVTGSLRYLFLPVHLSLSI